jgi:hypothetical protein
MGKDVNFMKNLANIIEDIAEDQKDSEKFGQDNSGYHQARVCNCKGDCDCE